MRCLWLTLADPDPSTNGQYLYSGGLIRAVASTGIEIHVVGLSRPDAQHHNRRREGNIQWWLAEHRPSSKWASLVSPLPHMANRTRTRSMRNILRELLCRDRWDVIVFDNLSTGWALRPVLARYRHSHRRPALVYLAHNHEESLRANVAKHEPHLLKRQVERADAFKVARLERTLVGSADLVTADAPEECSRYLASWPGKRVELLSPGYGGRHVAERRIIDDLPRRAIIVGSFDWIAKRMALEEFLKVADPLFAKAGVELQVVGNAEESFLAPLRRKALATTFTGRVDDVTPYMEQARAAIVPEHILGSGFKLKVLDYVFNRLPIFGLDGAVSGVPLRAGESIMLFADHAALAQGVLQVIDNLEFLNGMQERAYGACRDGFDWASRGRHLLSTISSLCISPSESSPLASIVETAS